MKSMNDLCLECGAEKSIGYPTCLECGSLFEDQLKKYPTEKSRKVAAKRAKKYRKKRKRIESRSPEIRATIKEGKKRERKRNWERWRKQIIHLPSSRGIRILLVLLGLLSVVIGIITFFSYPPTLGMTLVLFGVVLLVMGLLCVNKDKSRLL